MDRFVDRFVRFKALRTLWGNARALLAQLSAPHHQEARLRTQRWQQIQIMERHIFDGIVRGPGDPDNALRPQYDERRGEARAWQVQREAQRQWATQQQQAQQRQGR